MLQEILSLLPANLGRLAPWQTLTFAGGGLVLATAGARVSRTLITLCAVAGGTVLSLHAPAWFGWKVDGIGAAFCGAIAFGAAGFLLHKMLLGTLQASFFALMGGAFTWVMRVGPTPWPLPKVDPTASAPTILSALWTSMPAGAMPAVPMAIAIGIGLGALLALLWPRFSQIIFFSFIGTTIMILAAALAVKQLHPELLARIPADPRIELAIFAGVILIAMLIQWRFLPRAKTTSKGGSEKPAPREADDAQSLLFPSPSFASSAFPIDQRRQETAARRQRAVAANS